MSGSGSFGQMRRTISEQVFGQLTSIQSQAIPIIPDGKDYTWHSERQPEKPQVCPGSRRIAKRTTYQ